jgi:prolyl-tRNA synthetase
MLDSYSLDADAEGLDAQYRAHYYAYFGLFARCGLPVIAVGSDVGMMGGSMAHEYMYLTPVGEDTLVLCDKCGYAANRQVALFRKPTGDDEEAKAIEKVATPDATTIEALARLLGVEAARTAKAVFMVATVAEGESDVERFVFATVRGDMEVNETKLANAVGAKALRPAREDEIRAVGAEPGYGSPVGVRGAIVVVDDAVTTSPNLVAGANEEGYHLLNVNYGRDYRGDIVADIAAAQEGDACVECGEGLRLVGGVEVGNIFKLGTRYSEAMGCTFLDRDGTSKPVVMGSYGIGVGRLLACVAEEYNDERGLKWPITVAPFEVEIVALGQAGEPSEARETADNLYERLGQAGVEVLYDDREATPGVKFADADLIGMPLRLTVSARSLERGGVELKRRDAAEMVIVPVEDAVERVQEEIAAMYREIGERRWAEILRL